MWGYSFDIFGLIIIGWYFYKGFKNGLVKEFIKLFAFVGGVYVSYKYSLWFSGMLADLIPFIKIMPKIFFYLLTFVGVLFIINIIGYLITKTLKFIALNFLNRLLGGGFAVSKIVFIFSFLCGFFHSQNNSFSSMLNRNLKKSKFYQMNSYISSGFFNRKTKLFNYFEK